MNTDAYNLIWWVLFLPLIGFLLQALVGGMTVRRMGPTAGRRLMGTLAVLPIAGAFAIGAYLTAQLTALPAGERAVIVTLFDWIKLAGLHVPFEFRVDPLSMTMVLIITGIGALIHLYATGYMAEEKDYARFFTYLNLFIAFMLVLVLGNNLALLFIGWEGVGLCSYLLIGFWYKDLANSKAANKAFIVNRIGDVGLTLGIFLIATMMAGNADRLIGGDTTRFLSYDVILPNLELVFGSNPLLATTAALLLFVGACGKSAQFPLYLWLPDAMAGPTPVSALIHAATMVTAGVFLLNRMNVLFQMSPVASAIIAAIGAITALFAALIAFGQTDIKKVLAYSTVSQLGFMFVACGVGAYWAGMFHVTTHAFFKALLFLGSGAVIHAMSHEQDMRHYGNLRKYLPITSATMIIGWLAIAGLSVWNFFGFAGFYSKESILGAGFANDFASIGGFNVGYVAAWVALFVALLTSLYMTRMTMLTFFGGEERWRQIPAEAHAHGHHAHDAHEEQHAHAHHGHHDHGPDVHGFFYTDEELAKQAAHEEHEHHHALDADHKPHEVPVSMWFPLVVLAALSLLGGFLLYNNHLFEHWLYPGGELQILGEIKHYPDWKTLLVGLSSVAAIGGIAMGYLWYRKGLPKAEGWDLAKWSGFRKSAGDQFGYDRAMVDASVEGGRVVGTWFWKGFDAKIIDGLVNGLGGAATGLGNLVRHIQTGYVRSYAMMVLLGGVILLGYFAYLIFRVGGVK